MGKTFTAGVAVTRNYQWWPAYRSGRRYSGSDFPNLEKLILYVGVEDYGFEADIEIFRPLFSKERFPKLTYLGIVNSEEQDKIVEMFLESDILPQLGNNGCFGRYSQR